MTPFARAADGRASRTDPPRSSTRPSLRTLVLVGVACSGTGLLLAACSASSQAGSSSGRLAARPAVHDGAAVHGTNKFAGAPSDGTIGEPSRGPVRQGSLTLSTQSIIYTAYLTLRVKDVTAKAIAATTLITGIGGYVAGEQETIPHSDHATPVVTLTLKIPVTQYRPSLTKLDALGRPVAFSQHSVDVTQRVADVSSRVASAQAAIKQLRALLGKAGTVGALLQVQDEINSQESSLEALLAQQQALAHETSYATVTVTLIGPHVVVVKKHKKKAHGFGAGLRAGWHALDLVVIAVLTAIGAFLPFVVPVALILGIGYWARRRMIRRRRPPTADPPAAAHA